MKQQLHGLGGTPTVTIVKPHDVKPTNAERSDVGSGQAGGGSMIMVEHPSWVSTKNGHARAVGCGACSEPSLLKTESARTAQTTGAAVFSADGLSRARGPEELRQALLSLGSVVRYRNPCLWDAIGTGILRQVVRATQSRAMYRVFSAAYGTQLREEEGNLATFPSAETVRDLPDGAYGEMGLRFKMRPLRAAAEWFLDHHDEWREMAPEMLKVALQAVPGIGAWTAGAVVADWSNDWSLYPYEDLAVRKWAARAAPGHSWPTEEEAFAEVWRDLNSADLGQMTVLTLAWGSQHGTIG